MSLRKAPMSRPLYSGIEGIGQEQAVQLIEDLLPPAVVGFRRGASISLAASGLSQTLRGCLALSPVTIS